MKEDGKIVITDMFVGVMAVGDKVTMTLRDGTVKTGQITKIKDMTSFDMKWFEPIAENVTIENPIDIETLPAYDIS